MSTARCPVGARELVRRQQRLRAYVGQQIGELRAEAGVTQAALAAAAGIDAGHLSRIERGLAHGSLEILDRIAAGLGAEIGLRLFPGIGPRLRDRFQAPMIDALIRRLHSRWTASPELPVPRARGFIDLALGLRSERLGLVCEAQSEFRAIDVILRRLREKAVALADLGTFGPEVSTVLLVRSTMATRDIVRRYESTFAAAFPARIDDAMAALCGPDVPWPGPVLLWARVDRGRAELLERAPRGIRIGR